MSWITSSHHVLGIEHLLREFRNSKSPVLLGTPSSEWGKSRHEEVESGKGDHVDSKLPEVSIKLTWEPKTSGHT